VSECWTCNGLGQAIREDKTGKLYEWPCPKGCDAPPRSALIRIHNVGAWNRRAGEDKA
jgi:hypothetical protein